MTIDEAVQLKVEQTLKQKQLIPRDEATDIAKDEARKIYEMFNKEIDRQDRLWDQAFTAKPIKTGFWRSLAFWRR